MTKEELIDHLKHLEKYTHYSEDAPALREVIEMLECSEVPNSSDTISRQDAIDEWKNDFKGYINALDMLKDDYNGIMEYIDELPSAQPDIILCEDCKYWERESICEGYCHATGLRGVDEDHFCGYAEGREDGQNT